MGPHGYKKRFAARTAAFRRFNGREQKHPEEMGAKEDLAALGKLYTLRWWSGQAKWLFFSIMTSEMGLDMAEE